MSKSLKQMAYDTIEAHQETIADLRTQLEKASESYKELFSAFESCQGELKEANERVKELEALAEERAEFIINASNMASANEVYKRCKFPLKVAINKFAIEKKIEALRKFEPISNAVANHWCDKEQKGYLWLHAEILAEIEKLEQLRKEQSND